MKNKIFPALLLACAAVASVLPGGAAENKTPANPLTGEITPKLFVFDYFDGVGADRTSFLERYRAQQGWSGDSRSGLYMDLDLDLKYQPDDKHNLTVKRWGEGQYRHGGQAQWDTEQLRFSADYNFFRSASGGLDYLFSPNQVPGGTDPSYFPAGSTNTATGYAARFNNDSNQLLYHVNRLAYGLGFMIKPGVLGGKATLAVNYTGYLRYGQRLQPYVLGASDIGSTVAGDQSFVMQRWRGFSRNIDENMNRLSWSLTASPKDMLNLAYTGAAEWFDNRARDYIHGDIRVSAPYFYQVTTDPTSRTQDPTRPLGFIPDSTWVSHDLQASKTLGETHLAAGYSMSQLEQNSFTRVQIRRAYTNGEINTENAFVNFNSRVTPVVGMQGHIRYGRRDNDSSYPVANFVDGRPGEIQRELFGVRINRLESTSYGLAAVVRPPRTGSTVTLGWKAEDKSRDLTFDAAGIIPSVSTYRGDTETDEIYVKWSSLNRKGVTLRLTSSYAWADKTGLATEPTQAFGVKAAMSYTAPNGVLLSGYYSIKDRENDNHTWTDKAVTTPLTYTQDLSSTVQSAGTALNWKPAKEANAYVGLDWTRMDASVLFYESSRRRYEATTTFALRDTVGSLVDNYLFSLGGDYQANPQLKFTGAYNFTVADGNLASGYVARQLSAIDDTLDNVLHTIELGAHYDLSKTRQLRLGYRYDHYEDTAYPLLSGGVHAVMVAVSFRL